MTARPRRRFWLKLAAGLLFAVVAYGGAYSAMVVAARGSVFGWSATLPPAVPVYLHLFTLYGDELRPFFAPAHWVDRTLLRPEFWGEWPDEYDDEEEWGND